MRIAITMVAAALLAASSAVQAAPAPGYDIAEYLGMTLFGDVQMSPDGARVAFVTRRDDSSKTSADLTIWLVETRPGARPVKLTHAPGAFWSLRWSPSGRYLGFMAKREGDDGAHVFVLDTTAGEPRRVTSNAAFPPGIDTFDWAGSDDGLWVSSQGTDPTADKAREDRYGKVVRYTTAPAKTTLTYVATATGAAERTLSVDDVVRELAVSPDGKYIAVRCGTYRATYPFYDVPDSYQLWLYATDGSAAPRRLASGGFAAWTPAWSPSSTALYAFTEGTPGTDHLHYTEANIHRFDVRPGKAPVSLSGTRKAEYEAYVPMLNGRVLAATVESTHGHLYTIDARGRHRELREFAGRVHAVAARDPRGPIAFVLSAHDAYPELYIADSATRVSAARKVTDFNQRLTEQPRPTTQTVRWRNADGVTIEGILHWPPGKQGERGLPLVVDIHGGPWGMRTEALTTSLPYAYFPALLASRGYLALEVNYRGSVGRGDDFANSINGHSCARPADDILSGVDYLVEQGWADANRMAVMGYSYGGLLTNCLIGTTTRFKAAISGAGIWDETAYFGSADNWFQNDIRIGGAPWELRDEYWRQSAISRAANIKTPTLVVTGADDRRVPPDQSISVFRTLVRVGVPAELLMFPGQGHIFSSPQSKYAAVVAEIDWLDHYLRGTPRTVYVGPGPDADAHAAAKPEHMLRRLREDL